MKVSYPEEIFIIVVYYLLLRLKKSNRLRITIKRAFLLCLQYATKNINIKQEGL